MFVIFHPSEHTYSHSYVYSTKFFLYFRFAWTRNQVANKKGWRKLPFFHFLDIFFNSSHHFQPLNTCTVTHTCVLLIFFYILGLLGHQLSMPTQFMPLPPSHPALNEPLPHQHANQYWRTMPPHQHANQHQ